MPLFTHLTASLSIPRMSDKRERRGVECIKGVYILLLQCAVRTVYTLSYVHNETRVLVGVDIDHVPQGAIRDGRAEHRDVILKAKIIIN